MAFPDLAEHIAETFGVSDGMLYRLAVACTIRHETQRALTREWSKSPAGRLANRRKLQKRRADPAFRAAENARRRVLRSVQRQNARDAVDSIIARRSYRARLA